ncbi:hypothetical protein ECANGB1_2702 [Enterospora canceri]|uniref:Uncharacterized protein n=1 Tax=Enterospora canceri TaxID=1081671 RepID=A0A1Y1S732_9MICR|nr:hypothetical protein ECANGB1_2702 [Enterospora canceri]
MYSSFLLALLNLQIILAAEKKETGDDATADSTKTEQQQTVTEGEKLDPSAIIGGRDFVCVKCLDNGVDSSSDATKDCCDCCCENDDPCDGTIKPNPPPCACLDETGNIDPKRGY